MQSGLFLFTKSDKESKNQFRDREDKLIFMWTMQLPISKIFNLQCRGLYEFYFHDNLKNSHQVDTIL